MKYEYMLDEERALQIEESLKRMEQRHHQSALRSVERPEDKTQLQEANTMEKNINDLRALRDKLKERAKNAKSVVEESPINE